MKERTAQSLLKSSFELVMKKPVALVPMAAYMLLLLVFTMSSTGAFNYDYGLSSSFALALNVLGVLVLYYTLSLGCGLVRSGNVDFHSASTRLQGALLRLVGITLLVSAVCFLFYLVGFGLAAMVKYALDFLGLAKYVMWLLFFLGAVAAITPSLFFIVYYLLFTPIIVLSEKKDIPRAIERNRIMILKARDFLVHVLLAVITCAILFVVVMTVFSALFSPLGVLWTLVNFSIQAFLITGFMVYMVAVHDEAVRLLRVK